MVIDMHFKLGDSEILSGEKWVNEEELLEVL